MILWVKFILLRINKFSTITRCNSLRAHIFIVYCQEWLCYPSGKKITHYYRNCACECLWQRGWKSGCEPSISKFQLTPRRFCQMRPRSVPRRERWKMIGGPLYVWGLLVTLFIFIVYSHRQVLYLFSFLLLSQVRQTGSLVRNEFIYHIMQFFLSDNNNQNSLRKLNSNYFPVELSILIEMVRLI